MEPLKLLIDVWPILLFFAGVIVWFIRLEAKVLQIEKDLLRIEGSNTESNHAIWARMDKLQETLNQVLIAIGRLEGKIDK